MPSRKFSQQKLEKPRREIKHQRTILRKKNSFHQSPKTQKHSPKLPITQKKKNMNRTHPESIPEQTQLPNSQNKTNKDKKTGIKELLLTSWKKGQTEDSPSEAETRTSQETPPHTCLEP